MGKRSNGRYIIADVVNRQMAASDVRKTILMTAQMDRDKYGDVRIRLPQDPGQAGKEQAESYIKFLSGFNVTTELESGSKATRAEPMAAQWQAGNFDILAGAVSAPTGEFPGREVQGHGGRIRKCVFRNRNRAAAFCLLVRLLR